MGAFQWGVDDATRRGARIRAASYEQQMARISFLLVLALGFACSSKDGPPEDDAGSDTGTDAPIPDSAMPDTAIDAPVVDAGPDVFDAGPLTGDSYLFIVDMLDLGVPDAVDETIVPGFDLDDRVSDRSDAETCNTEDFTSPPPDDEEGVDNVLGPVLAEGEDEFMIRAALDNNVASGLILLMLEVRGVDDLTTDDRVEVDVLFGLLPTGTTMPMLEGDGGFVPGQTFDVDSRSLLDDRMSARVSLPGVIVDGRVMAGPGGLNLTVPFGAETITLQLNRVEARFDIAADAITNGVIGGSLDVEDTAAELGGIGGFDEDLVRLVLRGAADLDREGAFCTAASIGLVFEGVETVKGEIVDPPTP